MKTVLSSVLNPGAYIDVCDVPIIINADITMHGIQLFNDSHKPCVLKVEMVRGGIKITTTKARKVKKGV